jgi:O-antigen ligase
MRPIPALNRCAFWCLAAFAACAVASIALQNIFIWLAVALFLVSQWKGKLVWRWPTGLFPLATLIFLSTFFMGAFLGVNPPNSFQSVHKYLTFLLLFFIGAMPLLAGDIKKLASLYVYGAAFCALWGIGKHFLLHQERIDSFSGDKMVFAGMLMAALLLNIVLIKMKPRFFWHWLCALLITTALLFTQTRGAWLGFVAGLLLLLWEMRRRWLWAFLSLLLALYFLLPAGYQQRIKSIGDIHITYSRSNPYGNASHPRLLIWAAGWYIIRDYPMGIGQGNMGEIFQKYKPLALYEDNLPHLHNNALQICAQNGWAGLVAYLFWIFSFYWITMKFKSQDQEARDLNWAFLCVFSAVLVWGLTEYTFSHQFMNVQFFFLGLQANLWKIRA